MNSNRSKDEKGDLRMKRFGGVKTTLVATVIAGVVGAIIGALVTNRIFKKQLLSNQYSIFAEDIQAAVKYHSLWKSEKDDARRREQSKQEAEMYLNRAWTRALVTLPDDVFLQIDAMVRREKVSVESRNRLYHLLRTKLYPGTGIKYDDIMTTNIELKE